jgi:hypothetical protein
MTRFDFLTRPIPCVLLRDRAAPAEGIAEPIRENGEIVVNDG